MSQELRLKAAWPRAVAVLAFLMVQGLYGPSVAPVSAQDDPIRSAHRRPAPAAEAGVPSARVPSYKLDGVVQRLRDANPQSTNSVIVTLAPGAQLPSEFRRFARSGRLDIINGQVLELPNSVIRQLEAHPEVVHVHHNRPAGRFNYRTSVTVGATAVRESLGYTGRGVGIAVIDSGIASWHDDLTSNADTTVYPYGDQRVVKFVDFVNGQSQPYDDSGHGTHVSGIIAGNGYDSTGEKSGIAPRASIVSLKVLDADGAGTVGNIIAALNWVAANHQTYNIRIVNVSVGAAVLESYWTDPLTLAARALVERGIIVVAAAGNLGKNAEGNLQYGGITAPANAPWVLTVGASSTEGTLTREDDVLASYSSSGPTFIDFTAKPDLVAPGTGTVSLAAPGSTFYSLKPEYLVEGKPSPGYKPYLVLSGTSMAAPVVSGTLALMLEANPTLTPNLAKAILQYTAEPHRGDDPLRQGAGFLNALGAVQLAEFYAHNAAGEAMPVQATWSRQIIWGNYRMSGGYLNPRGNAWDTRVMWGATRGLRTHDNIVWGTACSGPCDTIVWSPGDATGTDLVSAAGRFENIVWGTGRFENIVWGTGRFENIVWGTGRFENIVWGTGRLENIVWGTGRFENIVWGTGRFENIVWGTGRLENIVWGTGRFENIVWGTDCEGADCDNVVWGALDEDGVVWGTAKREDNVVWGAGRFANIVWGTGRFENIVWGTGRFENIVWGTSLGGDVTWGRNTADAVVYPE